MIIRLDEKYTNQIAAIEKECFVHPWSEKSIKESILSNNYAFFGAVNNNKLCGYGGVNTICGESYITNIAVSGSFRKMGFGKEILDEIIKFCCTSSKFVSLEVRESNFAAIKLYEKSGFIKVGIRKKFYTEPFEDAVIMTKYFR